VNDAEAFDSPIRAGWRCTWINTESLDVRITSITYPSCVSERSPKGPHQCAESSTASRKSPRCSNVGRPDVCVRALKAHRAKQAAELLAAGVRGADLCHHLSRHTFEPDTLRRSWYTLRERAGLANVRFHDLRRSYVTLLLDLGFPLHIVMRIVGHATLNVRGADARRQMIRKRPSMLVRVVARGGVEPPTF
jgi:hypothetical protein